VLPAGSLRRVLSAGSLSVYTKLWSGVIMEPWKGSVRDHLRVRSDILSKEPLPPSLSTGSGVHYLHSWITRFLCPVSYCFQTTLTAGRLEVLQFPYSKRPGLCYDPTTSHVTIAHCEDVYMCDIPITSSSSSNNLMDFSPHPVWSMFWSPWVVMFVLTSHRQ